MSVLALSKALERGALVSTPAPVARALEAAWALTFGRRVVRRLRWPGSVRVVAVGGATLGGSGKTPLAIACAASLAAGGARVALVGHAYRASPGCARLVRSTDPLGLVGDEALLAARRLQGVASVVVAPSRAAALELAARVADVIVLDGIAQTAPVRASLALLAVDAHEPWGRSGALPPRGDLRAPVRSLVDAADVVIALGDELERPVARTGATFEPAVYAPVQSRGVRLGDEFLSWDVLRPLRLGLVCALARPERILRSLARRGVEPVAMIRGRDHGPIARPPLRSGARVDLWLASPKCALNACRLDLSAPVATLEHEVFLPRPLVDALTAAAMGNTLETSRNNSQKAADALAIVRSDGRG